MDMSDSQEWIFPKAFIDKLDETDSWGGVPGKRKQVISRTIWFIEDMIKALNMDRKIMSTAAVYFHRFFMFHSFTSDNRYPVALACIFLASKVEERPIKLKEVVAAFNAIYTKSASQTDTPKRVLLSERILLNTLGFELNVPHPLILCGAKLKELRGYVSEESSKLLYQTTMNFINDSFRSTLCLRYSALQIGTAMLFLATIQQGIKPTPPSTHRMQSAEVTWLELLTKDVEEEAIRVICLEMVEFYRNNADMVWMSDTKQLPTLKKSTYDTLGVSEQDSYEQDSAVFADGIQGSPSASSLDNDYQQVDSYEQIFEREEEGVGMHRVTVSRVHTVRKTILQRAESHEDDEHHHYRDAEASVHGGEATPLFFPPPPMETPNASSTPSFADLPSMKSLTRERSVSISEESCPGTDYKKPRY